ncbi:TetR/AcrR family transcriptional regulator [uncultured Jatrophihabitans sp.]|uniref:TetR/AcrR family transcriptional regulator n=1 Tax=uncultured Jatrophihabitans sp. TaxID=1610747 RepID=UPI0035CC870E
MTAHERTTRDDSEVVAGRPLRKDAARNRALLMAAAREVFAERGLDASLDDIAHRAGVGVGTAYRHFGNKQELASAILREAIGEFALIAEQAAATEDPWQALVGFLEAAAEAQTADRGLREALMGMHLPDQMDEAHSRVSAPLGKVLDRAKAAGVVRPDTELTDLGMVLLMLCTAADVAADVSPELWRRYLPLLLAGLRSSDELPVAPIAEDQLLKAMASYKHRMLRGVPTVGALLPEV